MSPSPEGEGWEGESRCHATDVGTSNSELRPRTPQGNDGHRAKSLAGPPTRKDSRHPLSTPSSNRPIRCRFRVSHEQIDHRIGWQPARRACELRRSAYSISGGAELSSAAL